MATTEHTINDAIAMALRLGRKAWQSSGVVKSENTGMLRGSAGRPDILVLEPDVSPVAIETEVLPAVTVEPEARSRIGVDIERTGKTVFSSIALRLPKRLRSLEGLELAAGLGSATDFQMALYSGRSPNTAVRWPREHWIIGGISDLSILTQAASVPPEVVDRAADELMGGILAAAGLLSEVLRVYPGSLGRIAAELRQEGGEQTWRMAAAILANAFVFHESLAGGPGDLSAVRSLEELRGEGALTKGNILGEWSKILKVNYWSIFDVARRILEHIPGVIATSVVNSLASTADRLLEHRIMRSHDLTGAVFQRLIADRKFLAAYYTTPASAALLAGLAISSEKSPSGASWGDATAARKIRIADFACGTGTLLSAAYQRVSQLHELAGGDAQVLHKYMMGGALVGCDVLPAASHLTAASLASVHPTETFTESSIITLAYGRQGDGSVALGSWNLLDAQKPFEIISITARATQGTGEASVEPWSSIPHADFDLVIMNPPFTRPTGHESEKIGVRNPMFAAFAADEETQRLMGKAASRLASGTSYHGNAGEGSIFLVLADRKLKSGGTLAIVLPLSLMLGDAWEQSRELLKRNYGDLIFITNAGVGGGDLSFSSDTDMGECLTIGRKGAGGSRAVFVTLNARPESTMTGGNIAHQIRRLVDGNNIKKLEDGPVGGTPLLLGSELIGSAITAPIESGWNLARIRDFALAQTAHTLFSGRLQLPGMSKDASLPIPVTTVGSIGTIGPYHADIIGKNSNGTIRGPFNKQVIPNDVVPTYPLIWEHEADRERVICFEAEAEAVPKIGKNAEERSLIETKANAIWLSASHCHFNRDFRFNSQSTSMQYTRRLSIGGRAWTSIKLENPGQEMALVLWANSTLGMLSYWSLANKQQAGRGSIGKKTLQDLVILDVSKISDQQIEVAKIHFSSVAELPLCPLNEIDLDTNRAEIDRILLVEILGYSRDLLVEDGPLDILRKKLALEPSIKGAKKREAE